MKRGKKKSDCPTCHAYLSDPAKGLICHKEQLQGYAVRTEKFEGRDYLVAPVVLAKQGVLHGSGGPIFYGEDELSKFVEAWNGRPVPIYHPENEEGMQSANDPETWATQNVGFIFNTIYDNGLKGEVWLDKLKLEAISPDAYDAVTNARPLEVSTGMFIEVIETPGAYNGITYDAIAVNIRPDHLALLPGLKGACSYEDGCGLRANVAGGETTENTVEEQHEKRFNPSIVDNLDISGTDFQSLLGMCHDAVRNYYAVTSKNQSVYTYLERVTDSEIVYTVEGSGYNDIGYYKINYEYDKSNNVVKTVGLPVEVERKVTFVEKTGTKPVANVEGGQMDKKVLIDALIAHKASQFTEADRAFLETQDENVLQKMTPVETPTPTVNAVQAAEVLKQHLAANSDAFIGLLPKDIQESVRYGQKVHNDRRAELIAHIVGNSNGAVTAELLNEKNTQELEAWAKAFKPVANYAPQGMGNFHAPVANNEVPDMVLLPCGVE